ncbi:MAG: precorrin-4 C(11)-methyltransferase [Deltaproteobacteria bacterium]|nr:precorrin-4 C(11)-methyltransferase [Deltaproteobacteria bacterium]
MSRVYFIGAGPGDPELMTLKGARIISGADLILYAGSLVNPVVLDRAKEGAEIHDTAKMDLDEIVHLMVTAVAEGKMVARLHTGDPAFYGAIFEQMVELDRYEIPFEVVPGVSAASAAAAALRQELTIPGLSQTVILTRREGRTPVPEKERLSLLAGHNATMVIFLSIGMIEKVVADLQEAYRRDTPCAVVYRAGWPDEKILEGRLDTIAAQVREAEIDRQALIVVGDVLDPVLKTIDRFPRSKLYDRHFSHGYRRGKDEDS